jgi:hypothetical protein
MLIVNLEDNGVGKPDNVALVVMVDAGALNSTTMKPVNNRKVLDCATLSSQRFLKEYLDSDVTRIVKPDLVYQTIRIDERSQSE